MKSLTATGLLITTFAIHSHAAINYQYQPALSSDDKHVQQMLKDSDVNTLVSDLSERYFRFDQPLTVVYGGDDGPLYDPQQHQVIIPYQFYTDSVKYFLKHDYQKKFGKPAKQGAMDTMLHTLLHEIGHAYIADQQIPILGKEEDAVDNFAAVLMINYVNGGSDAVISAADMFSFESEDRPQYYEVSEYIGEHSFDLQRYFSALCLVYGSDPEHYPTLLDEVEEDYRDERKDICLQTFTQIDENWRYVLNIEDSKSVKE
ncbi:DUF4344 domain-containing metallopeptidase [Vibrio methylphosphonaticus]|uniref:DUF4344 domain-containing metallopeptidase n=1 Tax=Vibrio methylphosphonaticus TaxID=2946866 RepID=UPI00202A4231|nr:DUF4344 domain-containing metallopeptidase [Vibrio methylphosphonaticus]MCL9775230.1 DUF4344 domain-containing metallopeptidase [Vibrio methylphosphonaticus]